MTTEIVLLTTQPNRHHMIYTHTALVTLAAKINANHKPMRPFTGPVSAHVVEVGGYHELRVSGEMDDMPPPVPETLPNTSQGA